MHPKPSRGMVGVRDACGVFSLPSGRLSIISSSPGLGLSLRDSLVNPFKRPHVRNLTWLPASRRVTTVNPRLPSLKFSELGILADASPQWTPDQIAGIVFAAFLLLVYASSQVVDAFVARAQRRQLGLCEKCGGLYNRESCPYSEKGECS